MNMRGLFSVGLMDGTILAGPLIVAALIWPGLRKVLLAAAIVAGTAGFLVTILAALFTQINPIEE